MNILFVNNYFHLFEASDSGASNRSNMFMKALASIGHVDVITFAGDIEKSNIPNCDVIYSHQLSYQTTKTINRLEKYALLVMPWKISKIYPVNKSKEQIIDEYIQTNKYDWIACRYFHEAATLGLLKYKEELILDLDDGPRKWALARAKEAWKSSTSLMNKIYSYAVAYTIDVSARIQLRTICHSFYSNKNQIPSRHSTYLHNVAINISKLPPITKTQMQRLIVIGTLNYYPNQEGISHFLNNIYPIIVQSCPNVSLHIVGKLDDDDTKKVWESYPNVTVTGFVPNIKDEYEEAMIAIIPIYAGGGTSIKLLEAMNMKRPCVSTPKGVRGFDGDFEKNVDYLLGASDKEFAEQTIKLLQSPDLCNLIADNAYKTLQNKLSESKFIEIVKKSIL